MLLQFLVWDCSTTMYDVENARGHTSLCYSSMVSDSTRMLNNVTADRYAAGSMQHVQPT